GSSRQILNTSACMELLFASATGLSVSLPLTRLARAHCVLRSQLLVKQSTATTFCPSSPAGTMVWRWASRRSCACPCPHTLVLRCESSSQRVKVQLIEVGVT